MTITILNKKRIVLGVCGSIACYKSVDLASKLTQAGAEVDVILTEAAQRFVTGLTFESVTGRPVYTDLWGASEHVVHVSLGVSADMFVVSPATAHTIGKLASGLADNLLTVTALTATCPMLVAPAMDGGMFAQPVVVENVARLRQRGVTVIDPKEGRMASGLVGTGRLPETDEMISHIRQRLASSGVLAGKRVLVTAGPTRERFDPVRFISNRSSGKQGVALAQAALDAGAQVTVIAGPLAVDVPLGARHVAVESAQAMHDAVLARLGESDLLMMAAAVGDFRPKQVSAQKIKKERSDADGMQIELQRNPDILSAVRDWKETHDHPLFVLGFAAETENRIENGRAKLRRKALDMIAINDVSGQSSGFAVDENEVVLLGKNGLEETLSLRSKSAIAEQIVAQIADQMIMGR